jgi:nucleoside-diphosphate-sugar epimerase
MRALVTGATGFIGGHLVERLCAAGHVVRALARTETKAAFLRDFGAEVVLGDVTDLESLRRAAAGIETVFHLASRVSEWGPWSEFDKATVRGTDNALLAATGAGVRRFIQCSSVAVYDDRYSRRNRLVREDAPHSGYGDRAYGHYSRSKAMAEELAWEFHERGQLQVTALRPALVYGPRDETTMPRLVEYLRGTAVWIGQANPVVDPIYVTDVADCFIAAAASQRAVGQAYNVAPLEEIGYREFLTTICQSLGIKPPKWTGPYSVVAGLTLVVETAARLARRKNPPTLTRAGLALFAQDRHHDPSKAVRELDWRPQVPLAEGVRRTTDWLTERAH